MKSTVSLSITPNRDFEPPLPQLLRIHRAIGRILHLSAAGDYVNDVLRDLQDMESGEFRATERKLLVMMIIFSLGLEFCLVVCTRFWFQVAFLANWVYVTMT